MLLAHGVEVSPAPGRHGLQKPLFEAIKRGSETIVSMLLSADANPNDRIPRWSDRVSHSPLMHAIPFEGVFRCLLAAGAEPTAIDSRGDSLLAFILESGQTGAVQLLIDQGLDLLCHLSRYNPLHQAIRGGRAIPKLLVWAGKWNDLLPPGHLPSSTCEKALEIAASNGQVEALQ